MVGDAPNAPAIDGLDSIPDFLLPSGISFRISGSIAIAPVPMPFMA